jgi:hypothetical protein
MAELKRLVFSRSGANCGVRKLTPHKYTKDGVPHGTVSLHGRRVHVYADSIGYPARPEEHNGAPSREICVDGVWKWSLPIWRLR